MDTPLAGDSNPPEEDPLAILRSAQEGNEEEQALPTPLAGTPEGQQTGSPAQEIESGLATVAHDEAPETSGASTATLADATSTTLEVKLDAVPRVQFVMHANDVEVLRSIRLENTGDEPLLDLTVVVRAEPAFAPEITFKLDELRPDSIRTFEPKWALDASFLDRLTERTDGAIDVEVCASELSIARHSAPITVFTRNEWRGSRVYPELLAALVLPNEPAVEALLHEAGKTLEDWSGSPTIDAYQRGTQESVQQQVAAVYSALASMGLQYVGPPASFETAGQRVRLPEKIALRNLSLSLPPAGVTWVHDQETNLSAC